MYECFHCGSRIGGDREASRSDQCEREQAEERSEQKMSIEELFIREYGREAWERVTDGREKTPVIDIGLFRNPPEEKNMLTRCSKKRYNEGEREVTENA